MKEREEEGRGERAKNCHFGHLALPRYLNSVALQKSDDIVVVAAAAALM